ncbi:MAG: hypothetical protein KC486_19050 [Myxococcales bacterium]|nr:hypothetical protein [Myxococcales bacterium]
MTHAELLTALLKGASPSDLDAYDIASKAYYRSSREQHLEAAVLFEAAAARAQAMFDSGEAHKVNEAGVRINQALNHWARAGFNFHRAGEEARALELLRRCVEADWLAAGLNHDLHTVGMCWAYLVREAAKGGREAFEAAFSRAQRECRRIGSDFPFAYPTRQELGALARSFGLEALAQEIVAPLRAAKPMKRDLRAWLKDFDASAPA